MNLKRLINILSASGYFSRSINSFLQFFTEELRARGIVKPGSKKEQEILDCLRVAANKLNNQVQEEWGKYL